MDRASAELVEIYLENGRTGGRLLCAPNLIPSPGQYLLTHEPDSLARPGRADTPLAAPVFSAGAFPGGFLVAPPIPPDWRPGLILSLRGPLGRGFSLPASARCVALAALGETAARLNPLLAAALGQGASVVLVSDLELPGLPPEVEVRSMAALAEVAKWADFLALDLPRESLPGLREKLGSGSQAEVRFGAHPVQAASPSGRDGLREALVVTPMPCGGMAECGVCAVTARRGWKMACKDGPVFDLDEII
jgi:hypothetical protein